MVVEAVVTSVVGVVESVPPEPIAAMSVLVDNCDNYVGGGGKYLSPPVVPMLPPVVPMLPPPDVLTVAVGEIPESKDTLKNCGVPVKSDCFSCILKVAVCMGFRFCGRVKP